MTAVKFPNLAPTLVLLLKAQINNDNVDPERKLNLSQLFSKVFQRAKEQNKFEQLWTEISKCYGSKNNKNPFSSGK